MGYIYGAISIQVRTETFQWFPEAVEGKNFILNIKVIVRLRPTEERQKKKKTNAKSNRS